MKYPDLLKEQYEYVREARQVLFNYCKRISAENFTKENSGFGRGGSIRNLLVHIANTYEFWIGKHGLNKSMIFTTYESKQTVADVIILFEGIDDLVFEFIDGIDRSEIDVVTFEINEAKATAPALKIFSHVITHEFHHKGQILSISRQLGYTPVDTDIMR